MHEPPPPGLQAEAQANPAFAHHGPSPGPAINVGRPQYAEVGPAEPQYAEVDPAGPAVPAEYDMPGSYPSSARATSTQPVTVLLRAGAGSAARTSVPPIGAGTSAAFSATDGYEQPDDVLAAAALQAAGGGYSDLEGALAHYAQSGGGAAAGGSGHYGPMPAPRLAESSI